MALLRRALSTLGNLRLQRVEALPARDVRMDAACRRTHRCCRARGSVPGRSGRRQPPPLRCPRWSAVWATHASSGERHRRLAAVPGRWWVPQRFGDGPFLYAIDAGGALRGVVQIDGVLALDWGRHRQLHARDGEQPGCSWPTAATISACSPGTKLIAIIETCAAGRRQHAARCRPHRRLRCRYPAVCRPPKAMRWTPPRAMSAPRARVRRAADAVSYLCAPVMPVREAQAVGTLAAPTGASATQAPKFHPRRWTSPPTGATPRYWTTRSAWIYARRPARSGRTRWRVRRAAWRCRRRLRQPGARLRCRQPQPAAGRGRRRPAAAARTIDPHTETLRAGGRVAAGPTTLAHARRTEGAVAARVMLRRPALQPGRADAGRQGGIGQPHGHSARIKTIAVPL